MSKCDILLHGLVEDVILEETESTKILGMYLDQGLTLVCAKVS